MIELLADGPDWHPWSWSCVRLSLIFPLWMNEAALRYWNSMDSIPADKVLKKTLLDLQKTFPDIPCVSQMLGGPFLRLGIPRERLGIPPRTGWGGKDTGWLTALESPLRTDSASWESIESFIQLVSFCNSCILQMSSRIVSRSLTNFLLATVSNVAPWNRFNSSISLRLFLWASRRSQFCFNTCSWRSCWSCRHRSSAWARWSSSCCDSIVSFNCWILLLSQSAWNSCFRISAWQSARIWSLCRSRRVLICSLSELSLRFLSARHKSANNRFLLSWLTDDSQDDRPSSSEWSARLRNAWRSIWPMVTSS